MDGRGQYGMVIFILSMVLVVAIIVLIIYLNGREEPVHPAVNATPVPLYNVTVGSDAVSLVSYELRNASGSVLINGQLFPGAIESFGGGVPANTTVTLSSWSDLYYYNVTSCNVTYDAFPCRLHLKPKALFYVLQLSPTALMIDPRGAVVQAPLTVCWSEHSGRVVNVIMDFPMVPVPTPVRFAYDFCYRIDEDVSSLTTFPLDVHLNPYVNVSAPLDVTVFDYEVPEHKSIGNRSSEVVT